MKKLLIITLLVGIGIFMGCSSEQVVVNPLYDKNLNQNELATAKKVFEVFCQTCQPLMGEYAGDIETIEISQGIGGYSIDNYKWDRQIYIKVKIKDRTNLIPVSMGGPFGHTLHFYLGGPKNPGITTTKFPQLCGVQKPSNGDVSFISVPSLSFIKK